MKVGKSAQVPAISLHAWSTGKQGNADRDSQTRQERACRDFAERHQLTVIQGLTLAGQSAYKGEGSFRGTAIDALIAARRRGEIPDGTVLIVEEFSRLSRKNPVDFLGGIINDLWGSGIALGVCQLDLIVDRERARQEPYLLHQIIAGATVSYEESLRKSKRSKSAWSSTKAAAESGLVKRKGVCPYWLRWDDAIEGWAETEYADTVRRIFTLSADGIGVSRIASQLNEEGIQSYGGKDNKWSFRAIHKLLTNPAVKGSWVSVKGELIAENYFPATVLPELYEQVQQGLKARLVDRSLRQCRVSNLLMGLTVCGNCGSKMSYNGRVRNGVRQEYLYCNGRREGRCDVKTYKYDERYLLTAVLRGRWQQWFEATTTTKEIDETTTSIKKLRYQHDAVTKSVTSMERRYQDMFAAGTLTATDQRLMSAAIANETDKATDLAAAIKAEEATLVQLQRDREKLDSKQFLQRVQDALTGSTEWDAAERLAFNRWLVDQGVTVDIVNGDGSDLGFDTSDTVIPSKLRWWLVVNWRDQSIAMPGSRELEALVEQG